MGDTGDSSSSSSSASQRNKLISSNNGKDQAINDMLKKKKKEAKERKALSPDALLREIFMGDITKTANYKAIVNPPKEGEEVETEVSCIHAIDKAFWDSS